MTATTALQDRLTAVVLADPDVHTIYPPRTSLRALRSQLSTGAGDHGDRAPKVVVSETSDGTIVTVSVGVTGEHPAATVCRNLHDHIASEVIAAGVELPVTIAVRIASIS